MFSVLSRQVIAYVSKTGVTATGNLQIKMHKCLNKIDWVIGNDRFHAVFISVKYQNTRKRTVGLNSVYLPGGLWRESSVCDYRKLGENWEE